MNTAQHLLFDLDALLDTRLGCLIQHDPKAAADVDMMGYRQRLDDDLSAYCPGVSAETYRQWYTDRTAQTLPHSLGTGMMIRLKAMTYEIAGDVSALPFLETMTVTVNTYPYDLTESETSGLKMAIQEIVADRFKVHMKYLPPEALTPHVLDTHYHYYALYDLDTWLTHHHEALQTQPMPSFPINAPKLCFGQTPDEADIEKMGLSTQEETFTHMEFILSAHVMLGYLDVAEYCQLL